MVNIEYLVKEKDSQNPKILALYQASKVTEFWPHVLQIRKHSQGHDMTYPKLPSLVIGFLSISLALYHLLLSLQIETWVLLVLLSI